MIYKNVWADDRCNFSPNCVMKAVSCDRVALVLFFVMEITTNLTLVTLGPLTNVVLVSHK